MKTVYAAALSRLCLSQAEAAELHDVRIDTVKSWSSGRARVPPGAWDDLRAVAVAARARLEYMEELHSAAMATMPNSARDGHMTVEVDLECAGPEGRIAAADFALALPSGSRVENKGAAAAAARAARGAVRD